MDATIEPVADGLFLIRLPVPLEGFDGFITAWWLAGPPRLLVDVGPAVCADQLVAAVEQVGGRPDMILLTHIHLDHGGAAGQVAAAWPDVPLVCHRAAIEHLRDPGRLWQGSLKTLGDVARAYGPPQPVPGRRLMAAQDLGDGPVTAVDTPGHSPHHCSFVVDRNLFAGEAAGVCLPTPAGLYMRPATPPRFFFDVHMQSLLRLAPFAAGRICYGHVGAQQDAGRLIDDSRRQLERWRELLADAARRPMTEPAVEQAARLLLERDPLLAAYGALDEAARRREWYFLKNSVKGFWGWLAAGR